MRVSYARCLPALIVAVLCSVPAAAAPITYVAQMSGPQESPPNASPGTGTALVVIDTVAHTLEVSATFEDLIGTTTAAHIHAPTAVPLTGAAGVATQVPSFLNFPLGVTAGTMSVTVFDLTMASSWNGAFITANGGTTAGAEAALATYLAQGRAYFNIHSSVFPGGEIRGFLVAVPEPSSLLLLGSGLAAVSALRRRRPRQPFDLADAS
jgi:hypothetical protein